MSIRFNPKIFLWAGAALILVLAASLSFMIQKRQDELSRASSYDLSWAAGQTVVEATRLGQAIGAHVIAPGATSRAEVELRLDLFLSRAELTDSPFFQALSSTDATVAEAVEEMRAAATTLPKVLEKMENHDNVEEAFRILNHLVPKLSRAAAAANLRAGTNAYEAQRSLLHWHWVFSGLTFSLILAGIVLLLSLGRQNRTLARTREAAEKAHAQAEISSQAKTDFLAAMSHEIRTPLNGIMGFTDLILGRLDLDRNLRRQVEVIRTSGAALLTVVNDVLDFSKIEAGAVELDSQAYSPGTMLQNSLSIVEGLALQKGLVLKSHVEPALPRMVLGDEPRLQQILLNLLNNAIKFTHAGSVDVRLSVDDGPDGRLLSFSITDTGIGIPPEKQDRLFLRFSQIDSSASRQYGGTGLGLAISKRLVDMMGGTIGVRSALGEGSTFWFKVPLVNFDHMAARTVEQRIQGKAKGRAGRILVAEDGEVNQEIIRAFLESAGHQIDIVDDGAKAVRAVKQKAYDLVLMDVQMPVVDGVQATRQIRALDGAAGAVPILAVTANVYSEQVRAFKAAGMNDHVAKPIQRASLLATVESWLTDAAPLSGTAEPMQSDQSETLDKKVYSDLSSLMGDQGTDRLLGRLEEQLLRLPIGAEMDRRAIAEHAHKLVSSAGMLGFIRLSQLCAELESACIVDGHIDQLLERVGEARIDALRELSGLRRAA